MKKRPKTRKSDHPMDKHERNTLIVQRYLKAVQNIKKGEPHEKPSDIYREFNITRQRFYRLLDRYGVTISYKKITRRYP